MLFSTNSAAVTLSLSVVLLSIYRIDVVHAHSPDISSESNAEDEDHAKPYLGEAQPRMPGDLLAILNQQFPGRTYRYGEFLHCISGGNRVGDVYMMQFRPQLSDYMDYKMFIGVLTQVQTIVSVSLSFYNQDDSFVLDNNGDPITYESNPHECGHMLDIAREPFPFDHANCRLMLKPACAFNIADLFLHFAQNPTAPIIPPIRPPPSPKGDITGPQSFSIDSPSQTFTVSVACPNDTLCMWFLDSRVISELENTTVSLTFTESNVGNRTLAFEKLDGRRWNALASLLLSILPSEKPKCRELPKTTLNVWLHAWMMSSPRVYFTSTYLRDSQLIVIAGGTANGSTILSTIDIFSPSNGECAIRRMNTPRMKHAAVHYDSSDQVLITGGIAPGEQILSSTEIVSATNLSVNHRSLHQARYSHVAERLSDTYALVVGGKSANNTHALELYNQNTTTFENLTVHNETLLKNLHGHSVTHFGSHGAVLIFGGQNGESYPELALLANQSAVENACNSASVPPAKRANHQAVYIPANNSILITGGNNDTHTLSTSYLYHFDSHTFEQVGSMAMQRTLHAAVLLADSSVLVIGGATGINEGMFHTPTISVEQFDLTSKTFTTVANLRTPRYRHTALLHDRSQVFVIGGMTNGDQILQTIEYMVLLQVDK